MAIAKWIPFGATQPVSVSTQAVKPQPVQASSADGKLFGLENFGNTCYANSVLQALYFCSPFRDLVIQSEDPSATQSDVDLSASSGTQGVLPLSSPHVRRKPERKRSIAGLSQDSSSQNGRHSLTHHTIPSSPPTLFSALRSLFVYISTNPQDKGTVAPRAFIDKLKEVNELFRSTMHQDAHEFLNYLLNKIVEEIEEERKHHPADVEDLSSSVGALSFKAPPTIVTATTSSNSGTSPQDATFVHRLFEGVLTSETRCLTCETVSSRDESFLDLSIDIEQNSSVTACLRQFSASEMLCQKNKFFCDSCCDLQEAEKRMKVKKLPNVLALHLKRFKYQEDLGKYIKLAYRVAFPFELRLFNTVDDAPDADRLYELFAIVVHIGVGPHHGHYVSIIKTVGSWLVFDDDTVESIKESEIPRYFGDSNSGSAYVLYYQAVDIDLAGLGIHTPIPEPKEQPLSDPPAEPPASPRPPVPAHPPGLGEDGDSSEHSEPPFPITPASQQSPVLVSSEKTPPRKIPAQPLTVSVTSTDDTTTSSSATGDHRPPSPPASPASSGDKGGLFRSLRHTHSTKVNLNSPLEKRKSATTRSGRPATSTGIPSSPTDPPPLPSTPNGKEKSKEPERKPSGWFKRRSKRPETAHDGSSNNLLSSSVSDSSTLPPSPVWSRNAGHSSKASPETNGHRASTNAALLSALSSTPSSPISSSPNKLRDTGHNRANGHENHSTDSPIATSSSSGSTVPSAVSLDFPQHTLSPIPGSPPGSQLKPPPRNPARPPPGALRSKLKEFPSSPTIAQRPSTAGAATGRSQALKASQPSVPIPPLPATPLSLSQSQPVRRAQHQEPMSPTFKRQSADSHDRPSTSHGVGGGLQSPSITASSSGSSTPFKRASRKLSLTAPLLGFGRKDKEKDREREKEKEDRRHEKEKARVASRNNDIGFEHLPPSAFNPFTMGNSRI
ncbi:hypothetical protein PLICRDRAFT_35479 [Plicaturopsis crispa FD-325 SS-3]|nr:hypothetical protein PLICRDRAFT_35479 [Plicaturopsis crispa FD-325 SS-3]